MKLKLYRGANAAWLLHRDKTLHYSLVSPCFSDSAWKYFNKSTGSGHVLEDNICIIRKGPWPEKGTILRFTLYGGPGVDWAFCYDLKTQRFKPSADQTTKYLDR